MKRKLQSKEALLFATFRIISLIHKTLLFPKKSQLLKLKNQKSNAINFLKRSSCTSKKKLKVMDCKISSLKAIKIRLHSFLENFIVRDSKKMILISSKMQIHKISKLNKRLLKLRSNHKVGFFSKLWSICFHVILFVRGTFQWDYQKNLKERSRKSLFISTRLYCVKISL